MTTSIAEVLKGIDQIRSEAEGVEFRLEEAAERRANHIRELIRRIKAGETTGDVLTDFYIVRFGLLVADLQRATPLHRVRDEMRKHLGEPILIVARREESMVCGGPDYVPRPSEYSLDTTMFLGFIMSGEYHLSAKKDTLIISVGGMHMRTFNRRDFQRIESDIDATFFVDTDVPLRCKNQLNVPMGLRHLMQREIIVGHAAVDVWLELPYNQRHRDIVNQMARALGKKIDVAESRREDYERACNELRSKLAEIGPKREEARRAVIRVIETIDTPHSSRVSVAHSQQLEQRRAELKTINAEIASLLTRAKHLALEDDPVVLTLVS